MARTWTDNSLRFTAADDGVDNKFCCQTITVRPSAASWVVVIKDRDGVFTKFEQSAADNRGDTYVVEGTIFNGAVLTTATNITSVTFNGTIAITN